MCITVNEARKNAEWKFGLRQNFIQRNFSFSNMIFFRKFWKCLNQTNILSNMR